MEKTISITYAKNYLQRRKQIIENDGYCPCQIKSYDSKCICTDFIQKLLDPNFSGWCICGLYKKNKEKTSTTLEVTIDQFINNELSVKT